ncbi:uncharacterized protein LOC143285548 isoform X2 [Babylonia areolata]|uniref:uncharacterized protein LOC143285548 isoform X2 n=1 Tax=Babylonia areolata TaxID=304850 RepID=UPI003FD40B8F
MAAKRSKAGYDGKIAGLYDLEETIGRGHFAVVKLARHVFTGEKVAVKVIDKTKLDEVSRSHLFQEVRCMKLVQHPNVVRLYEVIDTQTKLYLILELGDGGDMYDYIMRHTGGLEEKLAKRYFRQIVEAISYCHKLHVVHRDLKPENVVFFEKLGLVKLTDFGFSNMFAPGKKLETSCGSLAYSAPEILLGDSYDAPAVDVWSLGVILYMLVVGEAPFQEANDSETLTMIMDCRYHVPPHISEKCQDLIGKMLQREPVNRASLPHILAHPWLNDGDLSPVASYLPLITKEMISEEDHSYVVQKMVEGKIASREEILMSVEKNSYNHITATFYLLIERRLRKHQQHEYHLLQQQPSSGSLRKQSAPASSKSAKPHLEPLMLSPRKQREMKKTKTAPIPPVRPFQIGPISPSILVSPPVEESTTSPGPCFVKSLTTSMTLDRRKSGKKHHQPPAVSGTVSPHVPPLQRQKSSPGEKATPTSQRKNSVSGISGDHSPRLVKKNIQMSKSDPGAGSKRAPSTPVSKIALLSSFFERKAKEAAAGDKNTKFRMGWLTGRSRRPSNSIRQRVLESLETPVSPPATSVASQSQSYKLESVEPMPPSPPPPLESLPIYVVQESGDPNTNVGTSHYVQSVASPTGPLSPSKDALPSGAEGNLLVPPGTMVTRKCSLIKEESLDEYDEEEEDDVDIDAATIKPVKSLESLDDLGTTGHLSVAATSPTIPSPPAVDSINPRRPLKSVCSSPQLLNQIHEENESEDDDDVVPLKLSTPRRFATSSGHRDRGSTSPEILRKYEQRKKRRGAGQRGTSCSSSDASDTDDTESRSRKEKLHHKFIHRRDSSDHSSDTDGPGSNLGSNGRLGTGSRSRGSSGGSHTRGGNSGGGGGRGGGSRGGGGGGKSGGGEKKNADNRNHSNSTNKNSLNNHKNSQYHGGGGGGSKGSLTDASLKLLSRKLNEISTGVGALLSECRGSDCDTNDSPVHLPPSTPRSLDGTGSVSSGSLQRHSSLRSSSSVHTDPYHPLFPPRTELFFSASSSSPTQYLGQSCEVECIGRPPLVELSELSQCVSSQDGRCWERVEPCLSQQCGGVAPLSGSALLHCKAPPPGSVSTISSKSKCCSVV